MSVGKYIPGIRKLEFEADDQFLFNYEIHSSALFIVFTTVVEPPIRSFLDEHTSALSKLRKFIQKKTSENTISLWDSKHVELHLKSLVDIIYLKPAWNKTL